MAQQHAHSREPRPEMLLTDVEQLRAISDPFRLRIIEQLNEAPVRDWTAKELAERLGTKQTMLYHHLGLLEERGFITVGGTRLVSGILEKRYRVTASSFRVDRSLLAGSGQAIGDALDAIFEKARSEIVAGQRAGLVDLGADELERRRMALWMSHVRLSPAGVRKVMRLVERLANVDDLEEPSGEEYGLVVAFYPRATDAEGEAE